MEPVEIPCPECEDAMLRIEQSKERGVALEVYQCQKSDCMRKAIVVYEPQGGLQEDEIPFVQREIARRGAFFPSDYAPVRGRLR